MAQLFYFIFFILLGVTEFYLLAVVSYDCYIAICKSLHYMTITNHSLHTACLGLLAGFIPNYIPITHVLHTAQLL